MQGATLFDTKFTILPKTRRFMFRCKTKGCKTTHAFNCPTKQEHRSTRGIPGIPGSARHYMVTVADYWQLPELYCAEHISETKIMQKRLEKFHADQYAERETNLK
jgi:hypothetical protein